MKLTTTLTPRNTSVLSPSVALRLATLLSQPGAPGVRGSVWYAGAGAPPAETGAAGDYYIATDTLCLYGPKTTVWGASFACIAGTILSADILAALEAANAPSAVNPVATMADVPTDAQQAALDAATDPSAENPFVTSADLVSVKINPASVTPTLGGTVTGTIAGVLMHNDGQTYRVNETAGGLTVDFEFTGVASFNAIASRLQYNGGSNHVIQRKAWNWAGGTWDLLGEVTGTQTAMTWFSLPVPDAAIFIGTGADAGKVRVRWEHQAPFNASHYIEFDHVSLIDSDAGAGAIPAVTQGEAEAGTGTTLKLWSVQRVWQAITAMLATWKIILGQRDRAPKTVCADAVQDVTFDFNAGNSRYVDASAITGGKAVTLLATNFPSAEIEAGVDPQVVYTIYLKIGAARPSLTAPAGWVVGTLLSAITQSKTSVFTVDYVGTGSPTLTLLREY